MEDKGDLYIPVGLKIRKEYFEGYGKEELIKTLFVALVTGVIEVVVYLISRNISISVLSYLIIIAATVMMLTKDAMNLSVVDQINNMIRFSRAQKEYPYVALNEWKSN